MSEAGRDHLQVIKKLKTSEYFFLTDISGYMSEFMKHEWDETHAEHD